MKDDQKVERTLAQVEDTFYKTMSANTVFSALNKSASAQKKLADNTESLAKEMAELRKAFEGSSKSSGRVALALNVLTGALVLVGIAQVIVPFFK